MNNSEFARRGNSSSTAATALPSQLPETEYARRLGERQEQLAGVRVLHQRLWTYLTVVALAGIAITYATVSLHLISALWLLLPSVVIPFIIQSLAKNASTHSRLLRIVSFYELGLARLRHQWQGRGIDGKEFLPNSHLYASDLDIFGAGSLFELLCTARTGVGRAMLAKWLLNPAECNEVAARQLAVAELRDMIDLREYWASVGGNGLDQVSPSAIRDWADTPSVAFPLYVRGLVIALPICGMGLSIFALLGHNWLWVAAVALGMQAVLAALLLKKTRTISANLVLPSFELTLLVPLMARLETEQFECTFLRSLQSRLTASPSRPSEQIHILSLWVWLLNLRRSEHFALLASLFLWGTNLAILIEGWRQRNREGLATLLESLGQFETLLCLARYSYENPDNTFATVIPEPAALFRAEGLGHPLLDCKTCVRCDLKLDVRGTQLIMVSGSNMAGKSTLLRSVGVNSVLALAGAPVCAARLQIPPLQVACSIAVQDSLLQEKSRFQAEVERLKRILALSRSRNSLFLLDEVLGGTNSNDRFFGARAVVEQLTESGAVGLVTTHDLALTKVVEDLGCRAINVHFKEHYESGEMRFDYRMRSGVLARTNGLNVIAALGLLPLSNARDT